MLRASGIIAAMLIDRYVFREIAWPTALGLLVYTAIFLVNRFFMLADQWVAGTLTATDLAWSLVYYLPSILALAVPMSVLLGILIGFSRLSADSEITAMRTTGISYYRLLMPTAVLAVLGLLATGAIYIRAVPWANTKVVETIQRAARRTDLNREILPGTWVHLEENVPGSDLALFARGIETISGEPWLTDVEVLSIDRLKGVGQHDSAARLRLSRVLTSETTARVKLEFKDLRSIRWKPDDPAEVPTLADAREGDRLLPERKIPGTQSFATQRGIEKGARLQTLEELRATVVALDALDEADRLDSTDPARARDLRAGVRLPVAKPARDHLRRIAVMEIHKKFAIPVACIVFAMAGMPLGIASRRGGRPASFVISIGVVLAWWIVHSGGNAWAMAGKLSPEVGAWLPNIVLGIVGMNLLVGQRRQQAVGLYRALRDGQLLGATIFLVLAALLLYERFASPAAPDGRPPYSSWVPLTGLGLLAGHVVFVAFRDAIARRLAAVTEAFRRPRRGADAGSRGRSSASDDELDGPMDSASGTRAIRRAALLQRLRAALVFSQLALLAFTVLLASSAEEGLTAALSQAVLGWQGATFGLMLLAGVALQRAGAGLFSTLDWWVLASFVRVLALVMGSLFVIYCVIQYLELASSILKNGIPSSTLFGFFANLSPRIVFEMLPIAAMVAAIVTFGIMTKFNEMTALRCGGVSAYRVVFPVMLVGVLGSSFAFVLHDYVLPETNEQADAIRREIQGSPAIRRQTSKGFLMAEGGRALYQFRSVVIRDERGSDQSSQILALTVLRQDAQGRVRDLYSARDAAWTNGEWVLRNGWHAAISANKKVIVDRFTTLPLAGMEGPEYFAATRLDPAQMTFAEYARYVDEQAAAGRPTAALEVTLQKKLAFPAATMVLVLVGIPFAFTTGRRGALYGLGVSVILAVVYFAAVALFTALGSAGYLPPMAAAWAPNGVFAVAGIFFLLHVRT